METTARFYLERIRDQIDQARRYRYPTASEAPAKWLNLIAGKLKGVQYRLDQGEHLKSREKAEEILSVLTSCYDDLQILERADTAHVAEFVVSALYRIFVKVDEHCDYLFASGISFEVEPLYDGPPTIHHEDHRRAVALMKAALYRITMPGGALGATFHIPLVAHEAGHVLISKLEREAGEGVADIIERFVGEPADEVYRDWVKEIIADTVCGFIAGAAGFFALYEKLRGAGDEPDEEYPHNFIRLSSLGAYIRERHRAVFDDHKISTADWDAWHTATSDELLKMQFIGKNKFEEEVDYTALSRRLVSALPEIRDETIKLARHHFPEFEYSPARYNEDLRNHLQLILNAIPPFETTGELRKREPTDLMSILNIGWFVAAFKMHDLKITSSDGSREIGELWPAPGLDDTDLSESGPALELHRA